jgi:hypothetical protein
MEFAFLASLLLLNFCFIVGLAAIEEWHSGLPWGRVLDAGTGLHSLRWITSLDTEGWTAVTAETSILSDIGGITPRESDHVASGNWLDETFLQGELYDTGWLACASLQATMVAERAL